MRRRVIWSFVFTIPLFYISTGHMLGWPLPGVFLGTENSMVYALTLFLPVLPVAIINNKYYRMGFKTLFHGLPNMDSLITLSSGASLHSLQSEDEPDGGGVGYELQLGVCSVQRLAPAVLQTQA